MKFQLYDLFQLSSMYTPYSFTKNDDDKYGMKKILVMNKFKKFKRLSNV